MPMQQSHLDAGLEKLLYSPLSSLKIDHVDALPAIASPFNHTSAASPYLNISSLCITPRSEHEDLLERGRIYPSYLVVYIYPYRDSNALCPLRHEPNCDGFIQVPSSRVLSRVEAEHVGWEPEEADPRRAKSDGRNKSKVS